uniref:THAP domain-containing protein 1 n=1 Tax=Xiphophorus maculatus TaxID=8083 RepID=A0A3B5QXF9_XIPMA
RPPTCRRREATLSRFSFHGFPSDPDLQRPGLVNICRDNFKLTSHSKVCSLHFPPDQFHQPKTPGGRRMVKKGAVPVLFQWNNFCVQPGRASVWERVSRPEPDSGATDPPVECTYADHDYCSVPEPAGLDMVINENQKLKEEIKALTNKSKLPLHRSHGERLPPRLRLLRRRTRPFLITNLFHTHLKTSGFTQISYKQWKLEYFLTMKSQQLFYTTG